MARTQPIELAIPSGPWIGRIMTTFTPRFKLYSCSRFERSSNPAFFVLRPVRTRRASTLWSDHDRSHGQARDTLSGVFAHPQGIGGCAFQLQGQPGHTFPHPPGAIQFSLADARIKRAGHRRRADLGPHTAGLPVFAQRSGNRPQSEFAPYQPIQKPFR